MVARAQTKPQAKPKTDFERWQDYVNTSAQQPDQWNGYDCDIRSAVTEYNRYLMGNGRLPAAGLAEGQSHAVG